jgi:nucleoside-diphosphate-sugar epimerase
MLAGTLARIGEKAHGHTKHIFELLGWRPQYSLDEVLQAVIAYEQKKANGGRLA